MPSWGNRPIAIAGAGAVGCFIGGLLAAAGRSVILLGRGEAMARLASEGFKLTALDGLECSLAPSAFTATTDPAALAGCALVLVTVKSGDTAGMAGLIARHAPDEAIVVSLQNGISNARILRDALPGRAVLPGMVPYNVARLGPLHLHRASAGRILIGAGQPEVTVALSVPGLAVAAEPTIEAVQWGKLLINLNNALNALSGLSLRDELLSRGWRRLLAAQIDEGLAVLQVAGIAARAPLPVPIGLLPALLRLPSPLFALIARRMLPMDPRARSSMWDDLERRRPTEIDALQGEVLALADRYQVPAPVTAEVAALVKRAEAAAAGPPGLTPDRVIGIRTLIEARYKRQKR
jgi:2-dehydropantoate 2-reductase